MTFENVMEYAMDRTDKPIFPNTERTEIGGRPIARTTWHQFQTDEQIGDAIDKYRDAHYVSEVDKSVCRQLRYTTASLPRKARRSAEPILCDECATNGELTRDEMMAAVKAVLEDAWDMQGRLTRGGKVGGEARQQMKPFLNYS